MSSTTTPQPIQETSSYEYKILVKNGVYGIHKIITVPPLQTVVTSSPVLPTGKTFAEFAADLRKYYAALLQPAIPYESLVTTTKKG